EGSPREDVRVALRLRQARAFAQMAERLLKVPAPLKEIADSRDSVVVEPRVSEALRQLEPALGIGHRRVDISVPHRPKPGTLEQTDRLHAPIAQPPGHRDRLPRTLEGPPGLGVAAGALPSATRTSASRERSPADLRSSSARWYSRIDASYSVSATSTPACRSCRPARVAGSAGGLTRCMASRA